MALVKDVCFAKKRGLKEADMCRSEYVLSKYLLSYHFVMEGDLELTLGAKSQVLKPGESTHFNSDTAHKLKSLSSQPTRCLVVLYTV